MEKETSPFRTGAGHEYPMTRIVLRRIATMVVVVLPTLSLAVALTFWLHPRETATFGNLWLNAIIIVLLGPSVLGVLLVFAHSALTTRLRDRTQLGPRALSILVGAGLGLAFGAAWSLVVFWGIGVALLGGLAGAIYGLLSPS